MEESTKVTVTAKVQIKKYDVGVDPDNPGSAPFDVVEREVVLTGKDALEALKQINGGAN